MPVVFKKDVNIMNRMDKKTCINSIITSISIIAFAGLLINIANMITIFAPFENKMLINLVLYLIACVFGFAVLPYLYVCKVLYNGKMPKCNVSSKRVVVIGLILFSIVFCSNEKYSLIHNLIIATTEEILFRYIIFNILIRCFEKKYTFIVGSLIFSLVLHMNGDFLINFFTKIPASLLLYFLTDKYGIQDAIFVHWGYNSFISCLLN